MQKKTFLFIGDSITDTFKTTVNDPCLNLGGGYPMFIGANMQVNQYYSADEFINRGISGNRVTDLYARWEEDVLKLKPDVLSILIGVNDVWHEIKSGRGTSLDRFERTYNLLLEETKKVLPNCKIILLEPFILQTGEILQNQKEWNDQMQLRQKCVAAVALKHGCKFIPLQKALDEAAAQSCPQKWLVDGVHPSYAGHGLIAKLWLQAYSQLTKE